MSKTRHIPVTKFDRNGEPYTVECPGCKIEEYERNGWDHSCCPNPPHTCLTIIEEE